MFKNIFNNLKNDRSIVVYIITILIIVGFVILLLLQPSPTNINSKITPITTTIVTTTKSIDGNGFYSHYSIPSNFTSIQQQTGSNSVKSFDQTITNTDSTMRIIISTVPSNLNKRVNTGVAIYKTPEITFLQNMKSVTTADNTILYRVDENSLYFLADREAIKNNPKQFITGDRKIKFDIFMKTSDFTNPYTSHIVTKNNQEVLITALIDYDTPMSVYADNVNQLDNFLKSLKI